MSSFLVAIFALIVSLFAGSDRAALKPAPAAAAPAVRPVVATLPAPDSRPVMVDLGPATLEFGDTVVKLPVGLHRSDSELQPLRISHAMARCDQALVIRTTRVRPQPPRPPAPLAANSRNS